MYTNRMLSLLVLVLLASAPLWSASLDDARQMHADGKTEAALAAINELLDSDADSAQKAEALDLLGTIAVEKGYLAMAKQAWTQLQDEYPDFAEANDVGTKLLLVSALLKSDNPVDTAPAPVTAPVEASEPAEPATAAPPATAEATPTAAPAATASPKEPSGVVLLAIRGKPHDAVQEAGDRTIEFLRERGVDAQSATGGIPVVADSKMVLPLLLQKGQEGNTASVVLLTADYSSMQKMVLDCYMPEGAELWKVKVSGGTGWKGRPYSKSGINEDLVERFLEKLEKKIGGPGLPVTLQ